MSLQIIKADPEKESEELSAMQVAVLPGELPFPQTTWSEEKIKTWWIVVNEEKVGIISIEIDSAPGTTYESDSEASPGSTYLILIGIIPKWQGVGLGKIAMEFLKFQVRQSYGCTRIVSNLRPTNKASTNLHTSAGFKMVDYKEGYYLNPTCGSSVFEFTL